jgi:3',5'-cyclic AMP phosphodiesterase CpdA
MRVLHISDLHARESAPAAQGLLVEKFLEDVSKQEQEGQIDLVLFSGDCAFDGSSQGLTAARQLLLEPLAMLLPDRPVVLNHHRIPGYDTARRSTGTAAR